MDKSDVLGLLGVLLAFSICIIGIAHCHKPVVYRSSINTVVDDTDSNKNSNNILKAAAYLHFTRNY